MISEAQRLQYLDALGIDAWVSRASLARMARHQAEILAEGLPGKAVDGPALVPGRYLIGPGAGQTLFLCKRQEEASSRLASDIARCLDEAPVWGWQAQAGMEAGSDRAGMSLESAIQDRLFTRVLLFGTTAESTSDQSTVIGSARIIYAAALADLGKSPQDKRSLWAQLVANGWCRRFD